MRNRILLSVVLLLSFTLTGFSNTIAPHYAQIIDRLAVKQQAVTDAGHVHNVTSDKAHVKPVLRIKAWESQTLSLPQVSGFVLRTRYFVVSTASATDVVFIPGASFAALSLRGPPALG